MGTTNIGHVKDLDLKTIQKVFGEMQRAINRFDLDDGWEAAASPKRHRLNVVPSFVQVQVSDDIKGNNYATIHADSVTRTEISFTTAKAYMRILADK